MDDRSWLGLQSTHNSHRWYLPVTAGISASHGFLFGGSGLGAAIAAMEETTERPLVWATAQYLSYARTGSVMDLDVTLAVVGRQTTQARATGHVGGTEILTVNAALGTRTYEHDAELITAPDVVGPEDSIARESYSSESINMRMEQRWARPAGETRRGPVLLEPGRVALWVRLPDLVDISAATLGILGDFVPMGINVVTRNKTSANSLDNTLRVLHLEPTTWFLIDIHVAGIRNGFGHGHCNIFSENLRLMAVASQSAVVRDRSGERKPPRRFTDAAEQDR